MSCFSKADALVHCCYRCCCSGADSGFWPAFRCSWICGLRPKIPYLIDECIVCALFRLMLPGVFTSLRRVRGLHDMVCAVYHRWELRDERIQSKST
jgi:hypothetical protein